MNCVPLEEPLEPGTIYDSNRYTLQGMLTRIGAESIDMGVIRDRREDTFEAFREAATCAGRYHYLRGCVCRGSGFC